MSSIETRRNPATGTTSYRVRFRHEGKNQAVTFVSEDKARAWKIILDTMRNPAAALRLLEDDEPHDASTVADLIDHHIDHLTGVTDGTRNRYRTLADEHLRPTFGLIAAAELTRDDVARWVNAQDVAPKTLRNWHSLLSSALSSAVRDGRLEVNVAKGVKLPRRDQANDDMVFLTREEYAALHALIPTRWQPLVLTLVATGVRWGEATALTVGALDRATHSARIHQAWKMTGSGAMVLGPPKSRRSRRTVAMPPDVFAALAPLLDGKAPGDLVFLSPRGKPVRSGAFYNTVWKSAVDEFEKAHHKRPRVHDLRHTFASWAIQAGIPLPVIQRQMGHESITTTVDTYGHLARSDFDPLLALGTGLAGPAAIES